MLFLEIGNGGRRVKFKKIINYLRVFRYADYEYGYGNLDVDFKMGF